MTWSLGIQNNFWMLKSQLIGPSEGGYGSTAEWISDVIVHDWGWVGREKEKDTAQEADPGPTFDVFRHF